MGIKRGTESIEIRILGQYEYELQRIADEWEKDKASIESFLDCHDRLDISHNIPDRIQDQWNPSLGSVRFDADRYMRETGWCFTDSPTDIEKGVNYLKLISYDVYTNEEFDRTSVMDLDDRRALVALFLRMLLRESEWAS